MVGALVEEEFDDVEELELFPSRANAVELINVPLGVVDGAKFKSQMEIFDASPPTIKVRPSGKSLTDRIYASRLYGINKYDRSREQKKHKKNPYQTFKLSNRFAQCKWSMIILLDTFF